MLDVYISISEGKLDFKAIVDRQKYAEVQSVNSDMQGVGLRCK